VFSKCSSINVVTLIHCMASVVLLDRCSCWSRCRLTKLINTEVSLVTRVVAVHWPIVEFLKLLAVPIEIHIVHIYGRTRQPFDRAFYP
jgi:hypothetical protein